ncbi:hypothetical protein C8R26_12411 [Nitrosomonas oligotropha]|uniref:Recombinase RecT n=1 Tax=Nitrosomonas oligotropha TaxID=42354 RepID=A0A2T5HUZ5_9PROT|nr:hypothetical protein [Nitrosomonas oligotropha]PTQ75419.1 hypothetical protein C8R26_12411 [Nitrosomonas oligotropha]
MNATTQQLAELKNPQPIEAKLPAIAPGFGSLQSFELMQRAARLLSSSTLVPVAYRSTIEKLDRYGKVKERIENPHAVANCVIAMNMAQRMKADELMVMQNLYIVEGRPSWSSQWIIAAINGCGRFSPLRFEINKLGEKEVERTETYWESDERKTRTQKIKVHDMVCIAWATEKGTGERIDSPAVSIEMAVKEGWYSKNGSKWQTMPEVMLRYRTASFFGKLYAPELLMGLQTVEELQDARVIDASPDGTGGFSVDIDSLKPVSQSSNGVESGVDTSTGEIIDGTAKESQQAEHQLATNQAKQQKTPPPETKKNPESEQLVVE